MTKFPFVSVIMPIRNEAAYIECALQSILNQDYPHRQLEVLVVDGMSTDNTRQHVQQVIDRQRKTGDGFIPIVLLDNPGRIVPTAFNIGLRQAQGEIIVRVDGHCEIARDYISCCIEKLAETGVESVGGTIVTVGETWIARAIAIAQSSSFGVGGVAFRTGRPRGAYVDTLAFGAYRREVFDRIGGFDEELVRNQDDEFNFRLIQAGGKIWLDPSIRSIYYSRASFTKLWRQYFEYGLYKVRVIQKRGGVASWRHLVPAAFVLALATGLLLALGTLQPLWLLSVAGPYLVANLLASLWTARRGWQTLPLLPLVFLILHLSYGLGFMAGLWRWRQGFFHSQPRLPSVSPH